MPRLPIVGSDKGNWGTILNEFLEVEHNPDGTQKGLVIRQINVQIDSLTRSHTSGWALGPTFTNITGFSEGSLVLVQYHVPMRNNSTGWGGGYIEPQISFNGGSNWNSLGSSGYDVVMKSGGAAIASYYNSILVDPTDSNHYSSGDFSVRIRFYYRSYEGTVTVNGSHAINTISGSASLIGGTSGQQHFTKVIVQELG